MFMSNSLSSQLVADFYIGGTTLGLEASWERLERP